MPLIENNEGFYINEQDEYSPQELSIYLNKLAMSKHTKMHTEPRGFPTQFSDGEIQFSQFSFPFDRTSSEEERQKFETILFFHERFAQCLGLLEKNLLYLYIGAEKYYYNPTNSEEILTSKNHIKIKKPKILHVYSSNVHSTILNEEIQPLLKRLALPNEDEIRSDRYLTFDFSSSQYVSTLKSFNNLIKIKILDENNTALKLCDGFATYLVLKVISFKPVK